VIRLGPFDLDAPIGRGGMAEVWRATHRATLAPVAIKVLHAETARRHSARFRAEVRAMARLDHPSLTYVVDAGEVPDAVAQATDGRFAAGSGWVALELASGGPLGPRCGKLAWPDARAVLDALLDGLGHAHARGIIHRDIKPANVLLALPSDLRPGWKLTDFGLARAAGDHGQTTSHGVAGTPQWMAPEQIDREIGPHGPWTDLYAVGCVAWALLTGKSPYAGLKGVEAAMAHLTRPLPEFQSVFSAPPGVEAWLRRLLSREPGGRFQRASDAAAALAELDLAITRDDAETGPVQDLADRRPRRLFPGAFVPAGWLARRPTFPPVLRGAGAGLVGARVPRFVGRLGERECLWALLTAAAEEPGPRLVLLQGPGGMGRSRLAGWLAERAQELGAADAVTVRAGSGAPALDALTLRLARLDHQGPQPPGLRSVLDAELSGESALQEALSNLVAGRAVEDPARQALAAHLLGRWADRRPVVMVVDDAHLEPELIDFVGSALSEPSLEGRSVVWVLTARAEEMAERRPLAAALAALGAVEIAVGPLDGPSRLALLADAGIAPELAARLDEASGGNAAQMMSRLADWAARGWLVAGPAGVDLAPGKEAWKTAPDAESWAIRASRALDCLPPGGAQLLGLAAVLGPQVRTSEWAALAALTVGDDEAAREWVADRLLALHLAEETPEGWRFVHAGLLEALAVRFRGQGDWQRWHSANAAALARSERGDPERLGHHLSEAGRSSEALPHWLAAAERRRRTVGPSSAMALLAEAAAVLEATPGGSKDPRWGELALQFAGCYADAGERAESTAWVERLQTRPRRARWPALAARATLIDAQAQLDALALDAAAAAVADARAIGDAMGDSAIVGAAASVASRVAAMAGDRALATQAAQESILHLTRARVPSVGRQVAWVAAWSAWLGGDAQVAAARAVDAAARCRRDQDLPSEVQALLLASRAARLAGRADAPGLARDALARAERLGLTTAAAASVEVALNHLVRGSALVAYEALSLARGAGAVGPSDGWVGSLRAAALAAAAAGARRWDEVAHHLDAAERHAPLRSVGFGDAIWCLRTVADRAAVESDRAIVLAAERLVEDHRRKPRAVV